MSKKAPAADALKRFPVEVAGYLATHHQVYSSQIVSRVNATLDQHGRAIRGVGGKPVRVPLAFAEDITAALDDLLRQSPEVAAFIDAERRRRGYYGTLQRQSEATTMRRLREMDWTPGGPR